MFDELYFADRTNNSRIQDDVYIYSKDDIRIQKISIIKIALDSGTPSATRLETKSDPNFRPHIIYEAEITKSICKMSVKSTY